MKHVLLLLPLALLAACQREPEYVPPPAAEATPAPATPAADAPSPAASATTAPPADAAPVMEGAPRRIATPPATMPTPPLPPDTGITYVCENGSPMRISYDGVVARVAWTEGRTLTLSRSAGEGAGETYTGDGYVLQRRGNVAMLNQQGGTVSFRCEESTANA